LEWQYDDAMMTVPLFEFPKGEKMKTNLSKTILFFCLALALTLSACGAGTPPATPTAADTNTPLPTNTPVPPTATATITLTPTNTPKPTATPNLTATQQYEDFLSIVQKYFDAGLLPSLNGKYQIMDDYSIASTEAGSYLWKTYDNKIKNFIVQADIVLETAPAPASQSGCGFVFDVKASFYNSFVFLQRNGSAVFGRFGGVYATKYYDQLQNPAEFTMVIIVHNDKLRLVINDQEVIVYNYLEKDRSKNEWGPAILVGSTQDFGTRCSFRNIELWEISDN
jgi:hypothetical protein